MVTLVIMDGLGYNKDKLGNAVKIQGTPYLKKLEKMYPHTLIEASGEFVGLKKGQMGNSEVGHLNIGAGKVVFQDLPKIDNAIKSGNFFKNEALLNSILKAKQDNKNIHIMGLCSNGGVHSSIDHLKALINLVENCNASSILHLFLDGRDTLATSGVNFVNQINDFISNKNSKIGSLCGRIYAMDREKRYDRIQLAYNMLAFGIAENKEKDIDDAFANSYEKGVYDEYFKPTILPDFKAIEDEDLVIFFNFRTDRARELTESFTQENFDKFTTKNYKNLNFVTFTEYDENFKNVKVAFPPEKIENNLSSIISKNGLKQFHITETTKYAHITFFFNGKIETPYLNEDRKLIESEDVLNFASVPKMKAFEITEEVLTKITEQKYDFILVNLSNADMIGHTGDLNAAITAVEAVDKCAYAIALACLTAGQTCIITADHGNAEQMLDKKNNKITSHTSNPVPFILVSDELKNKKLIKDGKLANIAPTILKLLNLEIPSDMEKPMYN